MIAGQELHGRISRRGIFTSLDGTATGPVRFGHPGRAKGARQHVTVKIGPREFFGIHQDAKGTVKLFRKTGTPPDPKRGRS